MPKSFKHLLFIQCFLGFALCFGSLSAFAHGDGHDAEENELNALVDLYQQAIELEAVIFPDDASAARLDERFKNQRDLLDSGAWKLMTGYARLYYRTLHEGCPDDTGLKEEDFLRELSTGPARGGLLRRFEARLIQEVGELAHESFDVGARLGRTALISKIVAEGVETIGSKAAGGMGMHFFCTAVDAAILFGTRHIQVTHRTLAWAPQFNQSRLPALIRATYAHNRARRIMRQVQLIAGPMQLDEEELKELDEEGPVRWSLFKKFGWVKDGKRAKLLRRLEEQSQGSPTYSTSFKKHYGKRFKRFLWLKSRKRSAKNLAGKTTFEYMVKNKEAVWILGLQEGILNRANELVNNEPLDFQNAENLSPTSPVATGLLNEATERYELTNAHREGLAILMNDLDFIFDASQGYGARYTRVAAIESLFTVFIYELLHSKWESQGLAQISTWTQVWTSAVDRWKQGRFASLAYEFADYLSLAATSKDSVELQTAKYAAQDFLLKFYGHMQVVNALQQGQATLDQLNTSRKQMLNARPWGNRSVAMDGMVPFFKRMPLCEEL